MTGALTIRSADLFADPEGDGLLLRVIDDAGREGWGELVSRTGFSPPLAELRAAARGVLGELRGRDFAEVAEVEAISAGLGAGLSGSGRCPCQSEDKRPARPHLTTPSLPRQATAEATLPSPVRFAVESALLDLLGQARDVPLAALLGDPAPHLRRNALVYQDSDPAHLEGVRRRGFSTVKVKARGPWPASLRQLQDLRHNLGASLRLRIDCNRSIPPGDAPRLLEGLAALAPEYVEEPIPRAPAEVWRDLRRSGLRLAVDESATDEAAWSAHLEVGAAEVAVIKPAFVGGLFAARRRVREARSRGMEVVITSALEGAVGTAAAAHLAFAIRPELAVGINAYAGARLPPWLDPDAPRLERPRSQGLGVDTPAHVAIEGSAGAIGAGR